MKEFRGKRAKVLNYLKEGKGITSMIAFEKFGATRLSSIIFDLRKEYDIESIKCNGVNRYNEKVNYVEYRLIGEKNPFVEKSGQLLIQF